MSPDHLARARFPQYPVSLRVQRSVAMSRGVADRMADANRPRVVAPLLYHRLDEPLSRYQTSGTIRGLGATGAREQRQIRLVMERHEIDELHYITHVDNLKSILAHGILSRRQAQNRESAVSLGFVSVANMEIVERRSSRRIPRGLSLNQYANLYFNARNAMLFQILNDYNVDARVPPDEITILRVKPSILDLPNVVITDINAAAGIEPRYFSIEEGIARISKREILAEFWTDQSHKQRMMAEVLVPNSIPVGYVFGAYTSCEIAKQQVREILSPSLSAVRVDVNRYMFFQEGRS